MYKSKSKKYKLLIITSFYLFAIGILVAYAIVGYIYSKEGEKYLYPITAIAVVTTDVIIQFLLYCKFVSG